MSSLLSVMRWSYLLTVQRKTSRWWDSFWAGLELEAKPLKEVCRSLFGPEFHLHSNKRILSTSNCLCNVVFMHGQTNSTRPFPPNTRLSITRYLPAKPFHHLYTATTNTSTQNNCEQFRIAEKGHSSSILLPSVKRANFHEALTLSLFSGYKDRSSDTVFEFIYASGS